MTTYQIGYFVGSLSSTSINRVLSKALIGLAPKDFEFTEIPIGNLPLYSQDYDSDYPPEALALKASISRADAILFVTPEYNRSIPGALKNAIDWASRPWGQNSFDHVPAGVIGAPLLKRERIPFRFTERAGDEGNIYKQKAERTTPISLFFPFN